ncbi:MAG: alpha-glucosidase [Bacilli bacterium]|nr:alpha-glucosidase [Bacilli bacterium]
MRWYKNTIVYQIYPRSFQDSNNDGIGDLPGIISRLDYLENLGVTALWLSPIYVSPLYDNGYDIADYCAIHKDYGTMDDFKLLISEAHKRNLKIVMDLVVNHTSNEHAWFLDAISNPKSKYRDYYYIFEGKKKPNNWTSFFGGSAWTYIPEYDVSYMHLFASEQPDLNWENPQVRNEIKQVLKFWLDLGVDGFRCDVINILSKPNDLPNSHRLFVLKGAEYYVNGPKIHQYLQEIKRDVFDHYDMFTVGECVFITPPKALEYVKEGIDELNMVFQFDHMGVDNYFKWMLKKYKPYRLKLALAKWQNALNETGWNSLYLENHDQPRSVSRFGNPDFYYESATLLPTMTFLQKGTPFIYQGQEIGMTNAHFTSLNQYRDIETHHVYHIGRTVLKFSHKRMMHKIKYMSRDNARTPMQWDSTVHGGFSKEQPWIEANPNFVTINVKENVQNPHSIYQYYKKLIEIKKTIQVAKYGDFKLHYPKHRSLVYFERNFEQEQMLVICNYSKKQLQIKPLHSLKEYSLILNNYDVDEETLYPYQAKVYFRSMKHD